MAYIIPFEDLSFGTDMNQNYRARRVDFDEGFSQRASRLNGTPQQWRLVWERIRDDVAEELRLFFEARGGSELVVWKPYNQATLLGFTASNWTARPSGFLIQDCSIVLTQEYDFFELPPVNTVAPTILGSPVVGFVLGVTPGTWTGDTSGGLTYEWLRNGHKIAAGATYQLVEADRDAMIRVRVLNHAGDGTPGVAESAAVGPVGGSQFQPYALAFDFKQGQYWNGGTGRRVLADAPGYSYARSGAKKELATTGSVIAFAANEPGVVPNLGYWARRALQNNLLSSSNFAVWQQSGAGAPVTSDSAVAPDGTMTADTLADNRNFVTDSGRAQSSNLGATVSVSGTFSVFAKAGTNPRFGMRVYDGIAYNARATFDLTNGTIVDNTVGQAYIYQVGNAGWYRCVVTGTPTAGQRFGEALCLVESVEAGRTVQELYVGTGKTSFVWEAAEFDGLLPDGGPIIPTTIAVASIGGDLLQIGDAPLAGDQVFMAVGPQPVVAGDHIVAQWSDPGNNSWVALYAGSATVMQAFVYVAGYVYTPSLVVPAGPARVAWVLKREAGVWRFGAVRNGALTWAAAGAAAFPAGMTKVWVGHQNGIGPADLPIERVARLLGQFTDAQIIALGA